VLHRIRVVSGLDDALKELQEGIDFRKTGLVSDITPGISEMMQDVGGMPNDTVTIKKYAPDEIALDVMSDGGLLVLSDLYYPGWKVKVNGKEEKLMKVFGLLRGVLINKGKSDVLFYYKPMSLYAGSAVSLTAFLIWMIYLYYKKRCKRSL